MTGYWTDLDPGNIVQRVILHIGEPGAEFGPGPWAETSDPYDPGGDVRTYAGPGYGHDPTFPEQFAPQWDSVAATTPDENGDYQYQTAGQLTFHVDRMWKNTIATGVPNVWEPGVSGWHDVPVGGGLPQWVQPTGGHDAYPLGSMVTHNGSDWESLVDTNVWEPGATGTESLWAELVAA